MKRYALGLRVVAILLAVLAGFVDATGFIVLGGFFVSFMSGNSTRLAVAATRADGEAVLVAAMLVLLFVGGVVAGSIVRRAAGRRPLTSVVAFVALLVTGATLLARLGDVRTTAALLAFAMGAANNAFERDGEVTVGVTYVTGALVKVGQHLSQAIFGGDRMLWAWQALLWLGLVGGAFAGGLAWQRFGLASLWIATALAWSIAMLAYRQERAGAGAAASP